MGQPAQVIDLFETSCELDRQFFQRIKAITKVFDPYDLDEKRFFRVESGFLLMLTVTIVTNTITPPHEWLKRCIIRIDEQDRVMRTRIGEVSCVEINDNGALLELQSFPMSTPYCFALDAKISIISPQGLRIKTNLKPILTGPDHLR